MAWPSPMAVFLKVCCKMAKSVGVEIALDLIDDAETPVRFVYTDDDVQELAASIRSVGVLQPILVLQKGDRYELVAGHRRVHAARLAGLKTIPAVVTHFTAGESTLLALTENVNRAEMNVLEEAVAFGRWLEISKSSPAQLAHSMGRDVSYVQKRLMVLDLDEQSMNALQRGEVTLHHALELGRCEDVATRQYLLDLVTQNGASVRVLHGWVDDYLREGKDSSAVDLGSQVREMPAPSPVPSMGCSFCGRTADQVALRARFVCTDCDREVRATAAQRGVVLQ